MKQNQLLLMRHGTAGAGSGRDHERPLTNQGLDEAHRMGCRIAAEDLVPDVILCSSAVRCIQTAKAFVAGLAGHGNDDLDGESIADPHIELEDQLYNAAAETLLEALREIALTLDGPKKTHNLRTILLIAHNPGISLLALQLALGEDEYSVRQRGGFAPATLAHFVVDGDWTELSPRTARSNRVIEAIEI